LLKRDFLSHATTLSRGLEMRGCCFSLNFSNRFKFFRQTSLNFSNQFIDQLSKKGKHLNNNNNNNNNIYLYQKEKIKVIDKI